MIETPRGRAVIGIDAAWTAGQPSGVALVVEDIAGWRLASVQPSYRHFLAAAAGEMLRDPPTGSLPDVAALLRACKALHPGGVDLVAVDMPLSMAPITGRRLSDNLLSSAYGAYKLGTHSPSAVRPGRISDDFRADFAEAGYPLATSGQPLRALIEVYPHPALVELARAAKRLPYKLSRIAKYWPDLAGALRRERLLVEWVAIVTLLDQEIRGVAEALALPAANASVKVLKSFEDRLDAVVCAWIGICVLNGKATSFGDALSAVWVPLPTLRQHGAQP